MPIGIVDLPIEKVVGTKTSGRTNTFSTNFMPILGPKSEFATKWSLLYDSQLQEGLHDPIKAYEYLNRFYVQEGNKRVSVCRYSAYCRREPRRIRAILNFWITSRFVLYMTFFFPKKARTENSRG